MHALKDLNAFRSCCALGQGSNGTLSIAQMLDPNEEVGSAEARANDTAVQNVIPLSNS